MILRKIYLDEAVMINMTVRDDALRCQDQKERQEKAGTPLPVSTHAINVLTFECVPTEMAAFCGHRERDFG